MDYAIRDRHAIPSVLGNAVSRFAQRCGGADRSGGIISLAPFAADFRHRLRQLIRCRCGGTFDPVSVLHPCLEHPPALITARSVGMFVVHHQMAPCLTDRNPIDGSGERSETFGGFKHPVGVQLVRQQLRRRSGVLKPAARHFARQHRNAVAELLLQIFEWLIKPPDRAELRPRPFFVPSGGKIGKCGIRRLVIAVKRCQPNVVGIFAFEKIQKCRHFLLYARNGRTVLIRGPHAKP